MKARLGRSRRRKALLRCSDRTGRETFTRKLNGPSLCQTPVRGHDQRGGVVEARRQAPGRAVAGLARGANYPAVGLAEGVRE